MLVENASVVLQPLKCKEAFGKLHAKRYLKTREYTYFFVSKMNTSFLHTMNGNKPFDFLLRFTP